MMQTISLVGSALLADLAPETVAEAAPGLEPMVVVLGTIAALLLIAAVVALLVRSRRAELGSTEHRALDSDAQRDRPRTDPLADRIEVEGPVRITTEMSLREVKQAKAARLTGTYKSSEASGAERERRKRGTITLGADEMPIKPVAAPDEPAEVEAPAVATEPAPSNEAAALEPGVAEPGVAEPMPATPAAVEPMPAESAPAGPVEQETTPVTPAAPDPAESTASEPAAAEPTPEPASADAPVEPDPATPAPKPAAPSAHERTLEQGLARTRSGFMARLGSMFARGAVIDDDVMEELEEVLFTADIGVQTSQRLLKSLQERYAAGEFVDGHGVWAQLRTEISELIGAHARPLDVTRAKPLVMLMVGVNGAGKTTTIGKLAARFMAQGLKVEMVAADTFRAAAVDQLVEWGDRVGCRVHTAPPESDPSSVAYDGIAAATAAGADVVLVDTAGRLQTKRPLMDELGKISRVAGKALDGAPHETVLVLDANTGQNAIAQAKLFSEATPLTGIVLTKLDGTAKGGVVIGISAELSVPIYFVGIGEAVEDLRPFDAHEFVDALF